MNQNTIDDKTISDESTRFLKIENQLIDKTKQFDALISSIQGGVIICRADYDFTITYINKGFTTMTGYTEEDIDIIVERKHRNLIDSHDFSQIADSIFAQLEVSNQYSIEYPLKCKDGSSIWVIDKGVIMTTQNGEKYIYCLITDLTEQKKQNIIFEQKSFELLTITNNIDAAIIRHDSSNACTITYANDGFYRIIGYTKEEFEDEFSHSFSALIYDGDVHEHLNKLYGKYRDRKNYGISDTNVIRLIRKDKTPIWVLVKGYIVESGYGELEFHGVLTDIDVQKKQEEALRISDKRYEIAMQYAEVVIFDYIVGGNTIIHPDTTAQLFAVPNVLNGGIEQAIDAGGVYPSHADKARRMFKRINDGEAHVKENIMLVDINGKRTINEIHLINIYDCGGKPVRAVGVIKDITQTALLEKEKQYGKAMNSDRRLCYEANITNNTVILHDEAWANERGVANATSFTNMLEILENERDSLENELQSEFGFLGVLEMFEKAFENGQKSITTEFCQQSGLTSSWFEKTVNIIKDEMTGDISTRCYIRNIDSHKEKERKAQEEQSYYDAMVAKAITVYEVNITHNVFIGGHERWLEIFGFEPQDGYDCMIRQLYDSAIHADDRDEFYKTFSLESVMMQFSQGVREFRCEYRRPNNRSDGGFYWVSAVMHLFEDPNTSDIRGNTYVENIDSAKREQLDLIYKSEHDLLTGFYNKATLESRVDKFLSSREGCMGMHAYIIMDIDYFKQINDNFGHAFGDVVLSQTAKKLSDLFREHDILGRIGGDEFVMFMKNVGNEKIVMLKVAEICKSLREEYSQNGKCYGVSVSVGVAIFPEDGKDFSTLYQHSDAALYDAKAKGRDRAVRYLSNMGDTIATPKPISRGVVMGARSFKDNVNEYIFRILYDSGDWMSSINSVLELVGKHYGYSRAYIFEDSDDNMCSEKTFEWCNKDVAPHDMEMLNFSYASMSLFKGRFDEFGVYTLHDIATAPSTIRELLTSQQIKSILCFSITKAGKFMGFIGFDQCDYFRTESTEELANLRNISNTLGVFIMQMRAASKAEEAHKFALKIINGLVSAAYVCDPETHIVKFTNSKLASILPDAKIGDVCYEMFFGRDKPCDKCKMKEIRETNQPSSMEVYNEKLDMWFRTTMSMIDWFDNKKACLVDCVDISEYK